jgi:hypothetical protein
LAFAKFTALMQKTKFQHRARTLQITLHSKNCVPGSTCSRPSLA